MGMSFFGFLLVILFAFGFGNMGIPMGMAPGPEDPMMSKIAPDDCVAYASWSGFVDVDAKANPTEAWMSQPKVRAAGNKFRKAIWDMLSAKVAKQDPIVIAGTELLIEVGRIGSVSPGAFYADQIEFSKPQPDFNGGLLVSLGDDTAKVQRQFDDFAAMLPKFSDDENSTYRVKKIDGEKVIHVEAPQIDFEMNLKMHGKYFFIGFGEGSVAELKKNSKTDAPKWMVDLRETLKIDRVSSVSYLNSKPIMKQVKDSGLFDGLFQGGPLEKIVDADSVGWVSGVDSKGFLTRADIKKSKTKSGLLSIIELDPIPKRLVNDIPKDTNFVLATRISTKAILKLMRKVTRAAGEESSKIHWPSFRNLLESNWKRNCWRPWEISFTLTTRLTRLVFLTKAGLSRSELKMKCRSRQSLIDSIPDSENGRKEVRTQSLKSKKRGSTKSIVSCPKTRVEGLRGRLWKTNGILQRSLKI